ncbi:MAG: hypothetical protein P1U89_16870 [Verrucomicrobiales bacterium]|nr:hypothetical protein [Verrucomicrobiales bacterium]
MRLFWCLPLADACTTIVFDDRALNKEATVTSEGGKTIPIRTSIDVLSSLMNQGEISRVELFDQLTKIRRAGYLLIPLSKDELSYYLDSTSLTNDGALKETTELKTVREYILSIKMSHWLQVPLESNWLDGLVDNLILAKRSLWEEGCDLDLVKAQSAWIWALIDPITWRHFYKDVEIRSFRRGWEIAVVCRFCEHLPNVPEQIEAEYNSWVESTILGYLREGHPDLFRDFVESYKSHISTVLSELNTGISDEKSAQ